MKNHTALLILFLSVSYHQPTLAATAQSPLSIKQAIQHYIANSLAAGTDYKVKISQIDSRLKLPLCQEPLEISTRSGSLKPGRNSIAAKCHHTHQWMVYSTAIIHIYKKVMTLSQPIQRGEIFTPSLLKSEKKDISSLRSGFITDPKLIINKQATRNLSLGSVITKSNLTAPKLIKKGEQVTITVQSANLTISATGVAMMDGTKNQSIKVKNLKSKQIIYATVTRKGQVVVTL